MTALSSGMKCIPDFYQFNISDNRITEKGAVKIIQDLNQNIKLLDISNNNIGAKGCEMLSNYIIQPKNKFKSYFQNIGIKDFWEQFRR